MAQFNYARAASTAKRLISRFGQDVTLHVLSGGSGDPWNPQGPIETTYTLKAAVMDYKSMEVDGTLILATDKKVIVSTEGVVEKPSPSHSLTIGGVSHAIVNVAELNPGGAVVYYTLQVRS